MPPEHTVDVTRDADTDYDAIVVGAGPGGSSAAYHLARLGHRVLMLDRSRFPRDKSCGDGLTRAGVRQLAEMGVLDQLPGAKRVRGGRFVMRGRGSRDLEYPTDAAPPTHGLVVPRLVLDDVLCRHAVAAGAELWEQATATRLVMDEDGAVCGVEIERDETRIQLPAPVVVVAAGAASRLTRDIFNDGDGDDRMGFAIRGYYEGIDDLEDILEICMPLLDATDRYLLPSYGWIFPTGARTANIGVGIFDRSHEGNLRHLFERFLSTLIADDPRFATMRPTSPWRAAPLRFDFDPRRCAAPGVLLVGDAAGMVSPFTGEGISYALESGQCAATSIHEALAVDHAAPVDPSGYRRMLEERHVGYFEAGRRSARRYQLVWHVLDSTFHNERPLFAMAREAVLFPEGVGDAFAAKVLDDVRPLVEDDGRRLDADLLEVGHLLLDTARADWPFLARLASFGQGSSAVPFRPALLVLLAAGLFEPRRPHLHLMSAAVELGYLAALAHASVGDDPPTPEVESSGRPANWGNAFAIMVGDLLLARAYELTTAIGPGATRIIADELARACEARVREQREAWNLALTDDEYLAVLAAKSGLLFELPCRLGAALAGASVSQARAVATYGHHLGLAFQLADDARRIEGHRSRLNDAMGAGIEDGILGLSLLRCLRDPDAGDVARERLVAYRDGSATAADIDDVVCSSGIHVGVLDLARVHAARARSSLTVVASRPTHDALARLTVYAVERTTSLKVPCS